MERKGVTNSISLILLLVLSLGVASASLQIENPKPMYNLGDRLYINLNGLVGSESGNLNVDLVCSDQTINLIKWPARSFPTEKESSWSDYKILSAQDLEINDATSILGTCKLYATLGKQSATSESFTISKEVTITAQVDKTSYNPGEKVYVSISATKASGEVFEGFIQGTNAQNFLKQMQSGKLEETITILPTAESGRYTLDLRVYDEDETGTLNEGTATVSYLVSQIPTSLVPSISETNLRAGENMKFGVEVFDQSGKTMAGTATIKIISPEGNEVLKTIESGDFIEIEFPNNATAGTWNVYSVFADLVEQREFYILENQKVDLQIEDAVLTVTNIGNTVYNKSIDVTIGEETKTLELKLAKGEIRKFNLRAPQGEYEVVVGDGENQINRQVLLTGNAISIRDLERVGVFKGYSIIWVFIIIILASLGAVFLYRYRKTKTLGPAAPANSGVVSGMKKMGGIFKQNVGNKVPQSMKSGMSESVTFTNKSAKSQSLDEKNYHSEDHTMMDLTKSKHGHAESTLVMKGEKYPSAIISVRIKNFPDMNDHTKEELKKIVETTKKTKGLIDWRGDYIFIIYSPLVTKTYHNEALAVKAAHQLQEDFNSHNKKFKIKIDYNLSVHSGELLSSKQGGKLKYTSLGNTISFAKRMSDSDTGKLLVSDEVRRKMMRGLKAEKHKQIGEKIIYNVTELKNMEANQEKLKELLKRVDKDGSPKQ